MAKLEVTDVIEKEGRTCFYCKDTLIFSSPTQVPEKFQISQEAWDNARQMCVDARIRGNWVGEDITNPIPFEG